VIGGSPDLIRSETYAWQDGQSAGTLISRSDAFTDGLQSWATQYRDSSIAVTTYSQTTYGSNGVRTTTTTAADGSPSVTAYSYGRPASVTWYPSSGPSVGGTTYAYDPHGRQSSSIDARNGATSYYYNVADLVTNVIILGSLSLTTLTYYNPMLQAYRV